MVFDYHIAMGKLPEIIVKRPEFFLYIDKNAGITYSRPYFQPIAYDTLILHQHLHTAFIVDGNCVRIEAAECFAEIFPFIEYTLPR